MEAPLCSIVNYGHIKLLYKKLLRVHIPLLHVLSFLYLMLYSALQRWCSCSKRSMAMELFPVCLTSSSAVCLYKLLCHMMRSRGLVNWYIILSWSVGLVHMIYLLVISVIVKVQQPFPIFLTNVLALLVVVVMDQVCL